MVFLPHWPIPHGKKDINLGLSRVLELLDRLGNPHENMPPVIHIAGTNGKGSTLAYLKAVFENAGYRVHRYTSPHLVNFNERIEIAGSQISDSYLYEIMEEVRNAAEDLQTTFFEGTTVGAFLAFSRNEADVVLLETGMGGRLDATNVIKNPLLTIITPISFDHMEYLGETIEKIAGEKAGIIKHGVPCVISWQQEEAMEVFFGKCMETGSPIYTWGKDWDFEVTETGFDFIDSGDEMAFRMPKPALFGIHQNLNAATAVAALRCLPQYEISLTNIQQGIKSAEWPARLQKIRSGVLFEMLPNGAELWVDGAHNPSGAEMLAETISKEWSDEKVYLINGRTANRNIADFLKYFEGKIEMVAGVKVISEPSGEDAEKIANIAKELGFEAEAFVNIKEAVEHIVKNAKAPYKILAAGSLYLAGDVLAANNM